jgi:hypothetical protein
LLDKAIKKAETEKKVRDQKEAEQTKKEIEQELLDKKMESEQEQWESNNTNIEAKIDSVLISKLSSENEKPTSLPISNQEVSEERIEARPLPVKVRTAHQKEQ